MSALAKLSGEAMKPAVIVRCFAVLMVVGLLSSALSCREQPGELDISQEVSRVSDSVRNGIDLSFPELPSEILLDATELHIEHPDGGLEEAEGVSPAELCGNEVLPAGVNFFDGTFSMPCGNFDLHVQPVAAGILRLNYQVGEAQPALPYALAGFVPDPPTMSWGSNESRIEVCTPLFHLSIELSNCRVQVDDKDGSLLLSDTGDEAVGQHQTNFQGQNYTARTLQRQSPAEEVFLGLGEKTGRLNKRGGKYRFWNSDTPGYPVDHDPLYQSIPFYIGVRGSKAYGWFLNNSWLTTFDLASSDAEKVEIMALQGDLDQYLIAGPQITEVIRRYTQLTGRPPMPPRWTLGYHQARWSYYPDTQVKSICEEFRTRSIPADGIWLDIDYMDGFRSFTWDPDGFSDPAGLLSDLSSLGFKGVAIIDPGLKSDPDWDIYQKGVAEGHFLTNGEGLPFVGEVWPGPSVFPDFTRPATRTWWGTLFSAVTDVGIRGIWLDMNEPANFLEAQFHTVPGTIFAAGDGTPISMDGVHNTYALAEAMASFAGILKVRPNHRPFLLTRAGFAGIQRYAAIWTGDAASTMESLESSFTMLLGMGLSGLPFVGSDVGGWTGNPSPELFARWMEVGALSPFFRAHVATGTPDQEPWSFGLEVEAISRLHIEERYRLLPYFYSLFHVANQTGIPLLRAMPLEFQDDATSYQLDTQAMLGPFLLVAPVLSAGATERAVYFPAGEWLEWHSGAPYEGPGQSSVNLSLQALPTFLRAGAIVPTGPVLQYSDQAPLAPLQLDLYPAPEVSSFTLYEDDGETLEYEAGDYATIRYELQSNATGARLTAGVRKGDFVVPDRALKLRFRPADEGAAAVKLNGTPLMKLGALHELDEEESGYFLDPNDRSLWVVLPDQDNFVVECLYEVAAANEIETVEVTLRVAVPPGTPLDSPIYVATSAADWTQQPLAWSSSKGVAEGQVKVPRGAWFDYKYTRGDWESVEKWEGCLEAENRYAFGRAWPVKEDTVQLWADHCQ
jgi:alpha-glucosidase